MKKHSGPDQDWDALRKQIIGLGEESHSKNYYSVFRQSREALIRFRGVIEEIPDMIVIVDNHKIIMDLNETAVRVYGKDRKELVGSSIDTVMGKQFDSLKLKGSGETYLRSDEYDGKLYFRELEVRQVRVEKRPLWVVIGRDVTHRVEVEQDLLKLNESLENRVRERTASIEEQMEILKTTQKQLILSEKMAALGNLVAGVAHEINTPLGVGVTASSALQAEIIKVKSAINESTLTEKQFHEFLEYLDTSSNLIQINLERAAELIHSFKQIAVDQKSEIRRCVDFREYIDEVVRSLYPQWKRHSVLVEGSLEDEILTVPGDWSQILSNLIMNSVKHGFRDLRGGGVILIRIHREDDDIILDYRDNGCGLSEEQEKRIFEPFYTTARSSGGTGLGMHIVYNLVTFKMGGHISYVPGETPGTAFHIRIPFHCENPEESESPMNVRI